MRHNFRSFIDTNNKFRYENCVSGGGVGGRFNRSKKYIRTELKCNQCLIQGKKYADCHNCIVHGVGTSGRRLSVIFSG